MSARLAQWLLLSNRPGAPIALWVWSHMDLKLPMELWRLLCNRLANYRKSLAACGSRDRHALQLRIDQVEKELRELGVDPEHCPKLLSASG